MKAIKQLSLIVLVMTFILSACTVEKRVYLPGYSINWKKGAHKNDKQESVNNNANSDVKQGNNKDVRKTETIEKPLSSTVSIAEIKNNKIIVEADYESLPVSNQKMKSDEIPDLIVTKDMVADSQSKQMNLITPKHKKGALPRNATPSDGKSRREAIWLCALLGEFGAHRFYLGYPGIGIIELLTGGGLGIWYIIDFIRLCDGSLKPKYWHYQRNS